MNYFYDQYKKKKITADDLAGILKPGMKVYLEQGPAEPMSIVEGLMNQAGSIGAIELIVLPMPGVNKVLFATGEYLNHWRIYAFFGGQPLRGGIAEKKIEYIPVNVSEIPAALCGPLRPDAALVQVSPPGPDGFCSLGPAADYNCPAIEYASMVIAQVNGCMPVTCGDTGVHLSDIDYVIEKDIELIQVPPSRPGEVEQQVAENVAALVPDGSTIQVGIGGIPDAILAALVNKRDLGIHSGLMSERMVDLMESGVVTGRKKSINRQKAVTGVLLGTDRLYGFCDRNPMVELYPASYTHNRAVISRLDNFISINSVIEIDLTGQVNSEVVDGGQLSGVGGQVDFARIARLSSGGKSIFAMPSTARGKSKIVPQLKQGVPVTTPRVDVDYVVTEFGAACLRHRSLRERAKALIEIAHPDFREELRYWAEKV
jgi:4-hydroxybutyrate CoA-transferase